MTPSIEQRVELATRRVNRSIVFLKRCIREDLCADYCTGISIGLAELKGVRAALCGAEEPIPRSPIFVRELEARNAR
jgi:hypothetical protein